MSQRSIRVLFVAMPIVAVVVVAAFWYFCWLYPPTTVLVVRHADRLGDLDALSPLGEARAAELVHVAGTAGVEAIFTSATDRARRTGEDLAAHLGIAPIEYPPLEVAGLADTIRSDHRGETVFVVGHSNTVPDLVEELTEVAMPDIDEAVFDNLFVVTLCPCNRGEVLVNLRYGAPTP